MVGVRVRVVAREPYYDTSPSVAGTQRRSSSSWGSHVRCMSCKELQPRRCSRWVCST